MSINYDEIENYINNKRSNTQSHDDNNSSSSFNVGAYPLQVVGDDDDNFYEDQPTKKEKNNNNKNNGKMSQSEIDTALLFGISESLDTNNKLLTSIKNMLTFFVVLTVVSLCAYIAIVLKALG